MNNVMGKDYIFQVSKVEVVLRKRFSDIYDGARFFLYFFIFGLYTKN